MKKFIIISLAFLEFLIYTFLMVLVNEIITDKPVFKLIANIVVLIGIGILLYFLIKKLLDILKLDSKSYIYLIILGNIILSLILPVLFIIVLPNEKLIILAYLFIVSGLFYGLIVNLVIGFCNHFLNKN